MLKKICLKGNKGFMIKGKECSCVGYGTFSNSKNSLCKPIKS